MQDWSPWISIAFLEGTFLIDAAFPTFNDFSSLIKVASRPGGARSLNVYMDDINIISEVYIGV